MAFFVFPIYKAKKRVKIKNSRFAAIFYNLSALWLRPAGVSKDGGIFIASYVGYKKWQIPTAYVEICHLSTGDKKDALHRRRAHKKLVVSRSVVSVLASEQGAA